MTILNAIKYSKILIIDLIGAFRKIKTAAKLHWVTSLSRLILSSLTVCRVGRGWGVRREEGPGAPLTNFYDGGGGDRGSYFIPKKITTSEFVYRKRSILFLTYPKKSLSSFFATQKNPGVFHRPKKITFGQNFRPKKITRTPPRH